jgi:hypothetical protein
MSQVVQAVYENGVLRPMERLDLPEHQQVRVIVEAVLPGSNVPAGQTPIDPLAGLRVSTGIPDLAENFDDYRFGTR